MREKFTTGNVVSYTIIAILLAVVLIGVVAAVKHFTGPDKPGDDQSKTVANDTETDKGDETDKDNNQKLKEALESQSKSTDKSSEDKSSQSKPSTETKLTSEKPAPTNSADSENLPHTGPTEDLLSLLGVAVVVGLVIAYRRSTTAL